MEKVIFVTGNPHKYKEVNEILGGKVERVDLELDEIQSDEIYQIAKHKAKEAYLKLGKPVVIEDVSFYIEALNKLPGPFVKFFVASLGAEGIYGLIKNYKEKEAIARCVICYFDGKEFAFFTGDIRGKIVSPKGKSNFGFDPIFMPEGKKKTYAQMGVAEKNKMSHRFLAWNKFKEFLEKT